MLVMVTTIIIWTVLKNADYNAKNDDNDNDNNNDNDNHGRFSNLLCKQNDINNDNNIIIILIIIIIC